MNQFKNVFTGMETRDYKRAVSCQKCVRAGGKHNDLENVGFTYRHHTFFEMLGNFSFGDYFKKEAITYAWELLTKVYNIPEEKLYATVYKDDDEAFEIWHKHIGLPKEKIFRFGDKDNFWSMGDTGPCGPCSEVFYDHGPHHGCEKPTCTVGCECDRYVEIWNLVFMQYNRDDKGNLTKLPKPCVDTGAGLERITAVMQGVASNYDIDIFKDLKTEIEKSAIEKQSNKKVESSYNAVADHLRAIAFLISDGCFPSNEGAGYVLRRIIRRAIRHGKVLGFDAPFLYSKVGKVVELMGEAYPELVKAKANIEKILKSEEEKFYETLDKGLTLLEKEITAIKGGKTIPGDVAFKLYDTYGFPLDLTQMICKERGFSVDENGFNSEMEKQRKMARDARGKGAAAVSEIGSADIELLKRSFHEIKSEFVGYENTRIEAKCLKVIKNGAFVEKLSKGENGILIFDRTPFYAESGGQVTDVGRIVLHNDVIAQVTSVQKPVGGIHLHVVEDVTNEIKANETYTLEVTDEVRKLIESNHTATHMLHYLLRKYLGEHVKQAGSVVNPKFLTFDFSHYEKVSDEVIEKVEMDLNKWILAAEPVNFEYMKYDEAVKNGAMALFDEKYGDKVRVVKTGALSTELCGGTHVKNTSEIGIFKILSEESTGSGIRRIRAVTSTNAYEEFNNCSKLLKNVSKELKCAEGEIVEKAAQLMAENKDLRKNVEKLKKANTEIVLEDAIENTGNNPMVVEHMVETSIKELKDGLDFIKAKLPDKVVVLFSVSDNQPTYAAYVPKQLNSKIKANEIVVFISTFTGGKGGGSPEMAQGGGGDVNKVHALKHELVNFITNKLGA
jgi:alanyl-tRNA synthetase